MQINENSTAAVEGVLVSLSSVRKEFYDYELIFLFRYFVYVYFFQLI